MSFISMNLGKRKAKDLEDAPPDWISSKDLMAMPEQQFLDLKAKFENILCRDNECTVTRLNVPKGVYDLRRYHFHTFRRGEASNILAGKNFTVLPWIDKQPNLLRKIAQPKKQRWSAEARERLRAADEAEREARQTPIPRTRFEESGRPEKAKIVNKDLKAIHDYDILSYMREHISLASDIDPEDFFGTSLGQQPSCDKTISGDRGLLEPRILAISDSVDLGSTSSPQSIAESAHKDSIVTDVEISATKQCIIERDRCSSSTSGSSCSSTVSNETTIMGSETNLSFQIENDNR
ncbi:hypothetical protein MMC10_009512 [Thelotrema lepadinum]|nr:hypothetical protein [Thelotrema lepadinum]